MNLPDAEDWGNPSRGASRHGIGDAGRCTRAASAVRLRRPVPRSPDPVAPATGAIEPLARRNVRCARGGRARRVGPPGGLLGSSGRMGRQGAHRDARPVPVLPLPVHDFPAPTHLVGDDRGDRTHRFDRHHRVPASLLPARRRSRPRLAQRVPPRTPDAVGVPLRRGCDPLVASRKGAAHRGSPEDANDGASVRPASRSRSCSPVSSRRARAPWTSSSSCSCSPQRP